MQGHFYIVLVWLVSETTSSLVMCPSIVDSNILLPHQFECSSFFLCDNSSVKPSFLLRCPTGLYFNNQDQSGGCVSAEDVLCEPQLEVNRVESRGRTAPLPPIDSPDSHRNYTMHLANPVNCSQFFRYEGYNEPQLFECPDKLQFDPVLEICDSADEVKCQNENCQDIPEPECPPNNDRLVHLPHPTDCGAFYKCNWGIPILFYCPDGLYFNPKISVCDWPRNVECNRCQLSNGIAEVPVQDVSVHQRSAVM